MGLFGRFKTAFTPSMQVVYSLEDVSSQVAKYDARKLYLTQDNLQAVVNFRANSIAQLPIKTYIRDSETERKRDRDSVAAKLLWKPNNYMTQFEFMYATMIEWDVFGCCYWLVSPDQDSESGYRLDIIPSSWVKKVERENAFGPSGIWVQSNGSSTAVKIPSSEVINFYMYAPGNPGGYISPISGLKQTLYEQIESAGFRSKLWKSSGRLNAQIVRPKDVQPWDEETRNSWINAFREAWGEGGSNAGKIPLMEDGMEIKPFQTSFKEQQWAESVKLSRETCAAAYRINPSMIWHSDTQTYASSKDNARALYAECLGPDLQRFQQRINAILFPMIGANPNTYVEFDLTEKTKGSFEETASMVQAAVGGPWMTRNEARARYNLPAVEGGDVLINPLNLDVGGMKDESEEPTEPKTCGCVSCKSSDLVELKVRGKSSKDEDEKVEVILKKFFERQKRSILPKLGSEDYWDEKRWNDELTEDLLGTINSIADTHGTEASKTIKADYSPEATRNYLKALTNGRATAINSATKKALDEYLESEEEDEEFTASDVFEARSNRALGMARSCATVVASWATLEAVRQAESQPGYTYKKVEKVWVTGENARESHAAMNGERVAVDANFSNGAYWPGDEKLDPSESCGCNCSTEIVITEVKR